MKKLPLYKVPIGTKVWIKIIVSDTQGTFTHINSIDVEEGKRIGVMHGLTEARYDDEVSVGL